MLIMWKPVRLQGVGAATTIINANANPAGKLLDPWRRHINCLFGLNLQGAPNTGGSGANQYDPSGQYSCPDTGWNYFTAQPNVPQIDRLPLEATVGWDATLNGNLAEQLQEPSLMGAYEGAGITVLAKGLDFHGQAPWSDSSEAGAFPTVTTLLTGVVPDPRDLIGADGVLLGDANPLCKDGSGGSNRFPSNFICNPSRIDGLSVTNSSQGGGGIFVHGWAHFLEIANDRVYNNAGTLSGGISVGQGEFAPPYIQGGTTNAAPGSCSDGTGFVTNQHLPMCLQLHTNVHNNQITQNSSLGDELFSGTLSGGGGATVCTGNDYYKFNYNWICGNISTGEGGGMVHLGEIQNGDIEHNTIIFNQSANPTIPTNGGGIMVQGTPDTDPICGGVPDSDCPPGLSDGTGHGLMINGNLIQGNSADSGSGGGIRLQQVNGTEVGTFASQPQYWNDVTITNNMIVNNMAGWDGAGISLQDALNVNIINNTIMHNDTLASSGVLTNSIGTPLASAPAGNCTMPGPTGPNTASCPQSAGVTSTQNSLLMKTAMGGLTITCPTGHSGCTGFSNPLLYGDVIFQNRSFHIGVGNLGAGTLNQQKLVSLFDAFTNTPAPNQASTGACSPSTDTYWDLGVRGDKTIAGHESGFTLIPVSSFVTAGGGYTANGNPNNNSTSDPTVISQYCNGSRVPPECSPADGCAGPNGFGVPPGINDAVTPNPVFSLVPSATVDEGNNWINVSWGPLSMVCNSPSCGSVASGATLGNYSIPATSPVVGSIFCSNASTAISQGCQVQPVPGNTYTITLPKADFYGNQRPDPGVPGKADAGAVEVFRAAGTGVATPPLITGISPDDGLAGTSVPVTISGFNFTAGTTVTGITASNIVVVDANTVAATLHIGFTTTAGVKTLTVTTPGVTGGSSTVAFTVLRPTLTSITPASGVRGTSVNVTLTGTNLETATQVTIGGNTAAATAVNDTTVTATVSLAPGTSLGTHTVTVTTAGGATATGTFTFRVTGATLAFSGPSPALTTTTANTATKSGLVTVTNAATATGPLTMTAAPTITRVGTLGGTFSIIAGGTCTATTVLNPGASCTVNVQYAPGTHTATYAAYVTITGTGISAATLNSPNFNAN
jgi:hypothetical protein